MSGPYPVRFLFILSRFTQNKFSFVVNIHDSYNQTWGIAKKIDFSTENRLFRIFPKFGCTTQGCWDPTLFVSSSSLVGSHKTSSLLLSTSTTCTIKHGEFRKNDFFHW